MLGVGVGIMLLLVVVGMTEGTIAEVVDRMLSVDADLIVHMRGFSLTDRGAPLREAYRPILAGIEGVAHDTHDTDDAYVVPVAYWWVTVGRQHQNVLGVLPRDLPRIRGLRTLVAGRDFTADGDEMIIDQRLADAESLAVGDAVEIWARTFRIVGICETGVPARVMMSLRTLQRAAYNGNRVCTFFFLKCAEPRGRTIDAVIGRIEDDEDLGMHAVPVRDYYRLLTENLSSLRQFVQGVTAVGLAISFLVVSLSMYTTVLERTREVGILKSMGAGRAFIVGSILTESVLLCVGGVAVGFGLAALGKIGLERALPLMTVSIEAPRLATAAGLGLAGGVLGALYPARRAARLDPVVSLSYE